MLRMHTMRGVRVWPMPVRQSALFSCALLAGLALAWGVLAAGSASAQTTQPDTKPASAPASQPSPAEIVATEIIKVVGQSEPQVRQQAAVAILKTGSAEGVKALLTVFTTPNNEAAKLAVCKAVAEAGNQAREFVEPMMALLRHESPALRQAAASALAGYTDPEVSARLAQYQRAQERELMAETLSQLMDRLYAATPDEAKRTELLSQWLQSPLALQRLKALQLIHNALRAGRAMPAGGLLAQIRTVVRDPNEEVRNKTVVLLRDLGMLEDAPLLRGMLAQERFAAVRAEIYRALGKLDDLDSIPACVAGVDEANETVAAAAADALGKLCRKGNGRPENKATAAVNAIIARMKDATQGSLRSELVEAMGDIADPRFLSLLVKLAGQDEPDPAIRRAALRGLGTTGDASHADVVIDRLTGDLEATVREAAAEAAGVLGSTPAHLQALRSRLDPNLEPAIAVTNQAWTAYQTVFQRLKAENQLAVLETWYGSTPEKVLTLIATVKPQARQAVAARLLNYLRQLNQSDNKAAAAFYDQLLAAIPDGFGNDWAPRFQAATQPASAASQPASTQPGG